MTNQVTKKKSLKSKVAFVYAMIVAMLVPMAAHATETGALELNFDVAKMFTWTQTIINALMPVVYVTLGIALGFLIIRALKSAFN